MAAHIPLSWAHKNVWSYIYIFIYKCVFFSMPEQSRFTVIFCTTVVHMLPYLTITRIRCSHYLMPEKNGGWRQFFFSCTFGEKQLKIYSTFSFLLITELNQITNAHLRWFINHIFIEVQIMMWRRIIMVQCIDRST